MAVVKLAVKTEYMEVSGGKLVSGNREADPVAKYFANHLTDHYAEYGKEFPIFNRLAAFAVLTSIAAAVREDGENPLRQEIEDQWRLDEHQLPLRETPATTPAVVATHGRAQLTGGVRLQPNNQNHLQHPRTQALQQDVLASRPTQPGAGPWSVTSQGVEYQVVPARPRRARRTWQEDLAVGSLRLVRENGPRDSQGKPTPGWYFRMPRLQLDSELVNYEGAGKGPKAAYVYDEQGRPVMLAKFGKLTMPGNPPTPGYGDESDSRNLYLYSNGWMYLEGDIDFVSINGGPATAQLGPDARVVEFSPKEEDGHRVESVQTAAGKTIYEYDGERLARMRNDRGDAIRFDYDAQGRLIKAIGSDGQNVSYVYDDQGRLASLANNQGSLLSYLYGEGTEVPIGIRAELRDNSAAAYQPALQARIETPTSETPQFLLNDPLARHVSLELATDGSGDYLVTVRGKGLSAPLVERLPATANTARYNDLAQQLRKSLGLAGAEVVLVTGPAAVSQRFAGALRSPDLPDLRVFSGVSATLADQNLHSRPAFNGKVRVVIHADKMLPQVAEQLKQYESAAPDAGAVLVIGHNTPSLAQRKVQMGNDGEFAGRNVGFIACPSPKTPGEDDNTLRAHGAVSVTGLGQPIPQSLLPYFVPAVVRRLEQLSPGGPAAMRKDQTMESIFRGAADEVEQLWKAGKLPSSIEESDIQLLRLIYERLGCLDLRRYRTRGSEGETRQSLAA
jgi:YD repeat-containing protein